MKNTFLRNYCALPFEPYKSILAAGLLCLAGPGLAAPHSLVIAVDGLRGDGIENASTPNLDALIKGNWAAGYQGAYAHYAQTTRDAQPSSGPNHVGIMTGVVASKHGVTNNSNVGQGNYADYPHYLSMLESHNPALNTAYLVTWGTDLQIPSGADLIVDSDDAANTQRAVSIMQGSFSASGWAAGTTPHAVFLFLDDVDHAGHDCCFTPSDAGYRAEITEIDQQIGQVLNAVKARPDFANEDWQIVVTSDHGGRGSSHGIHAADNYTIPFIVASRHVAQGYLHGVPHNYDAAPTALQHMGMALPGYMDGKARGNQVLATVPDTLQTGLLTYLPFEGNYQDASGNNHHAVNGGGTPSISSGGKFGRYLAINGSDEYVSLGKKTALDFGSDQDYSILAWYRVSGDQSGDPVIIGNKDWGSGANPGTVILANEGNGDDFGVNLASSSADRLDVDPVDYSFNEWWMLLTTFDRDGAVVMYAGSPDGRLYAIAGDMSGVGDVTSSLPWNIGQDGTGSYKHNLKADIDEVAIWGRALSLDEVRHVYKSGEGLALSQIISGQGPRYIDASYNFTVGEELNVLLATRADGQVCGFEWDNNINLFTRERNAKWDCRNPGDELFFRVDTIDTQTNGNVAVTGIISARSRGVLEWDGSISGNERNAKFDERSSGDPVTAVFKASPDDTELLTQAGSATCGMEWDNRISGGERNAKWDCAPNHDRVRFELIN